MEDQYNNSFENESREEFLNRVESFAIDIANQMHISKGKNPVNNPFRPHNPREDEINFAVEVLAEMLRETHKGITSERTIEEHLIIHLIKQILTNTDGWSFNPRMNKHPDGTDDMTLFTATNENAIKATADIMILVFAPDPSDNHGMAKRSDIIAKYKARYVQPGSWVLWYDAEHRQLVKFDFTHMTQEVVAIK